VLEVASGGNPIQINPMAARTRRKPPSPPADLRSACLSAAWEVIASHGVEQLSLRDVARRLGVSHQAPYRHFPSRDHLLAEILRQCFTAFSAFLAARPAGADPHQDLHHLGLAYFAYADEHPLEYRLMFGHPWPTGPDHASVAEAARQAFAILVTALRRVHGPHVAAERVDHDALFVWSTIHGLSSLMQIQVLDQLLAQPHQRAEAMDQMLGRIGLGLSGGLTSRA
jgi:AcrR family transcriptional regulator